MKILITGAAGFIGSHLAEKLSSLGHDVVGIDAFKDYYSLDLKELNARDLEEKGIKIHRLDLASDDLTQVLDGVEVVYHLAAQPGISSTTPFESYLNNNLVATQRLIEACRATQGFKFFINIATSSVYGKFAASPETAAPAPTSNYGVTKLAAEQLVLSYNRDLNFPACSIRLFSVYGPRERPDKAYTRLIKCILNDQEFPLTGDALKHVRSFTYVSDIVDGLVLVLENKEKCLGEIFNLGCDTTLTTGEGFAIIEQALGKKANMVLKPARPGDQEKTQANIDKARSILKYEPKVKPEQGLPLQVEWYKNKIHGKINL